VARISNERYGFVVDNVVDQDIQIHPFRAISRKKE
jgi:hypothetical protein